MMMFDRAALKPDAVPGRAQIESGETSMFWMGSQPFLKVNSKGERFFNESGTYEGILHADEFNKDHCIIPSLTPIGQPISSPSRPMAAAGCSRSPTAQSPTGPISPWRNPSPA